MEKRSISRIVSDLFWPKPNLTNEENMKRCFYEAVKNTPHTKMNPELKNLFVSPEAMEDLKNWSKGMPPEIRDEVFINSGTGVKCSG